MSAVERIAVIAGGLSHERGISLESGREAANALGHDGVSAEIYEPDSQLLGRLIDDNIQVCYLALHGSGGEDGSLQDALEFLGIPFIGSSSRACRRAWNKVTALANIELAGIPVPPWSSLHADYIKEMGLARLQQHLGDVVGYPLVVKPGAGGSAQGLGLVEDAASLSIAVPRTLAYGETIIFERAVFGREVSVIVVEDVNGVPRALPPVELLMPLAQRVDFAARHDPEQLVYAPAAEADAASAETASSLAVHAHRELGLSDLSRSDFIIDADGHVSMLEVSLSPGLSRASSMAAALEYDGSNLATLLSTLVTNKFN